MAFRFLKIFLVVIITFNLSTISHSKDTPASFADLAEKLMPSVVDILTTQTVLTKSNPFPGFEFPPGSPFEDMFKDFGTPQKRKAYALGSGFVIDSSGIIVTNNHVIKEAEDILIKFEGGQEYEAKVIGSDPYSDIAILKIESNEKFIPVKFGDSDKARIGDPVIAIGNPLGLGGTVTAGIISARNRAIGMARYEDFIQTDASINQGNSGGPLFNMDGDVIGINTAIYGRQGNIGIGFAIPSNSAKKVINQLIEYGETKRGWLGVMINEVTKEIAEKNKLDKPRGALVVDLTAGGPSDKGGIKVGDIILEFNGKLINNTRELIFIVAQTEPGKTVDVKVLRSKREVIKKIKLARLETSNAFKTKKAEAPKITIIEGLKITVRALTKQDIEARNLPKDTTGAVIVKIENDSPINYLNVDNIIIEAQKKKIKTVGDLKNIVNSAIRSADKTIMIAIYNNQSQKRYIGVKLD